jgi:hypothetical protein
MSPRQKLSSVAASLAVVKAPRPVASALRARARTKLRVHSGVSVCEHASEEGDIVKDVRGSESNCEQDSRKM